MLPGTAPASATCRSCARSVARPIFPPLPVQQCVDQIMRMASSPSASPDRMMLNVPAVHSRTPGSPDIVRTVVKIPAWPSLPLSASTPCLSLSPCGNCSRFSNVCRSYAPGDRILPSLLWLIVLVEGCQAWCFAQGWVTRSRSRKHGEISLFVIVPWSQCEKNDKNTLRVRSWLTFLFFATGPGPLQPGAQDLHHRLHGQQGTPRAITLHHQKPLSPGHTRSVTRPSYLKLVGPPEQGPCH